MTWTRYHLLKVPVPMLLENEMSLHWQIWSLFQPICHPRWIKNATVYILSCLQAIRQNKLCVAYCFINSGSNGNNIFQFPWCFFRWFLLNYINFVHATSHIKPSEYDQTSGTKFCTCFGKMKKNEKTGGNEAGDFIRKRHL